MMSQIEWQLHQVVAGAEVVLIDAQRRPVARGIVSRDRRTLRGPNGERITVCSVPAAGVRVVRGSEGLTDLPASPTRSIAVSPRHHRVRRRLAGSDGTSRSTAP